MTTNKIHLKHFFKNNLIDIEKGDIFEVSLPSFPSSFNFDRIEGMLLGLAIGDSLGNTTESWSPEKRKSKHGEIRDYLPNQYADNKIIGLPSDDTQLSFWTLEQMIVDKGFVPENVSQRLYKDRIFGIGGTFLEFIENHEKGLLWYKCGIKSAGNGALMRIAPMLILHIKTGGTDIWIDVALSAMLTHNDSGSIAACISFINMLWQLLQMDNPPEPLWWLDEYVKVAQQLERDFSYQPRFSRFIDKYTGPIWRFVDTKVREMSLQNVPALDACNSWGSGAYLLETIPGVIYILMKHGDNLEEAIVRAVNDTKDNDTIAAIVGAAVGALHGKDKIPKQWLDNLSGRTTDSDDGKIFKLLATAKQRWWD